MKPRSIPSSLLVVLALLAAAAVAGAQAPLPASNGRQIEPGLVFSGQPTADELASLPAGTTVLDLRTAGEDRGFDEEAAARGAGLSYRNVEVNADALADPAVHEAFRAALEDSEGGVLVHCASGNRVGALFYAYLVTQKGVSREEARARAQASGLTSDALAAAIEAYLDGRSDD